MKICALSFIVPLLAFNQKAPLGAFSFARVEFFSLAKYIMLSTTMRQRVEFICSRIAQRAEVELADMAWLQKLAARNPSVDGQLKKARYIAINGDNPQESLDGFCQAMGLADPDPSDHLTGPQDALTIAEWFQAKQRWFRGQNSF